MTKTTSVKKLGIKKLVDELGVLKAQMHPIKERTDEIANELKDRSGLEKGDQETIGFDGIFFRATVEASVGSRLNSAKIKKDHDATWLKKYSTRSETIKVVSRTHKGAGATADAAKKAA